MLTDPSLTLSTGHFQQSVHLSTSPSSHFVITIELATRPIMCYSRIILIRNVSMHEWKRKVPANIAIWNLTAQCNSNLKIHHLVNLVGTTVHT